MWLLRISNSSLCSSYFSDRRVETELVNLYCFAIEILYNTMVSKNVIMDFPLIIRD